MTFAENATSLANQLGANFTMPMTANQCQQLYETLSSNYACIQGGFSVGYLGAFIICILSMFIGVGIGIWLLKEKR